MNLRKLLKMIYRVYINFKEGILDPEAEAINKTIDSIQRNWLISPVSRKILAGVA